MSALPRLPALGASLCAALVALGGLASARAAEPDPAAAWLLQRQAADGSFGSVDGTGEALVALVAGGLDPSHRGMRSAVAFVERGPVPERPAHVARIAMGLHAVSRDASAYARRIAAAQNPATGAYETGVYAHALAMLGVAAGGSAIPQSAVTYLQANRCPDGGYAHDPGCVPRSDADTTALAICALRVAGVRDTAARDWLRRAKAADGGYPHFAGGETNANSTGLALSALAALGERDDAALRALRALRARDGGFRYRAGSAPADQYATVQALPGLMQLAYPVRPRAARSTSVVRGSRSIAPRAAAATGSSGAAEGVPNAPGGGAGSRASATDDTFAAIAQRSPAEFHPATGSPSSAPSGETRETRRRNPVGMLVAAVLGVALWFAARPLRSRRARREGPRSSGGGT